MGRGRGESKISPRRCAATVKRRRALELRIEGLTFDAIARRLGYAGPPSVSKAITESLTETLREPAEQLRAIELARLDRLQLIADSILEKRHVYVCGGKVVYDRGKKLEDDGPIMQAIATSLKVMERRARLLGLDAPAKLAGPDGGPLRLLIERVDPATEPGQ